MFGLIESASPLICTPRDTPGTIVVSPSKKGIAIHFYDGRDGIHKQVLQRYFGHIAGVICRFEFIGIPSIA
jgi:hypothetical protein